MNARTAIIRYELTDALRSRWILMHGLFYMLLTEGLLLTSGYTDRALISLIDVVLLLVPLVGLVFGTIHFYNVREFVQLMLTQPVRRADLFTGVFAGHVLPLASTFVVGVSAPFLWHGGLSPEQGVRLGVLLGSGVGLTIIFAAMAFAISIRHGDRVRGIGIALLTWLLLSVMYDGAILLAVSALGHYPIEKAMAGVMLTNPVDLVRLNLLVHFDASAMMGYTGAVLTRFFGSNAGSLLSLSALAMWIFLPLALARRWFFQKDF